MSRKGKHSDRPITPGERSDVFDALQPFLNSLVSMPGALSAILPPDLRGFSIMPFEPIWIFQRKPFLPPSETGLKTSECFGVHYTKRFPQRCVVAQEIHLFGDVDGRRIVLPIFVGVASMYGCPRGVVKKDTVLILVGRQEPSRSRSIPSNFEIRAFFQRGKAETFSLVTETGKIMEVISHFPPSGKSQKKGKNSSSPSAPSPVSTCPLPSASGPASTCPLPSACSPAFAPNLPSAYSPLPKNQASPVSMNGLYESGILTKSSFSMSPKSQNGACSQPETVQPETVQREFFVNPPSYEDPAYPRDYANMPSSGAPHLLHGVPENQPGEEGEVNQFPPSPFNMNEEEQEEEDDSGEGMGYYSPGYYEDSYDPNCPEDSGESGVFGSGSL